MGKPTSLSGTQRSFAFRAQPRKCLMGETRNVLVVFPVVFAVNNDPVATGLVASLNRPGGNLTGVAYLTGELGAKRLGLMHEIVPKVVDFAVLAHPTYSSSAPFISDVKAAART